jgi:hypothetical protein
MQLYTGNKNDATHQLILSSTFRNFRSNANNEYRLFVSLLIACICACHIEEIAREHNGLEEELEFPQSLQYRV